MLRRMKNAALLLAVGVFAVWAATTLVGVVQGGPMDPWAPPGPTMKPLDAVEPRIPIWQPAPGGFPIVISQPGSYYLGESIAGEAGADGIHITVDNITLDLNGFALIGAAGQTSFNGVTVPAPAGQLYNISIYNGTIRGWGGDGICAALPCGFASNSQFRDLRLDQNAGAGIRVSLDSTVSECVSTFNGAAGISVDSGVVTGSTSSYNGGAGIVATFGGAITSSLAAGNTLAGIDAGFDSIVTNCSAVGNGGDGIFVGFRNVVLANDATSNGGAGVHVGPGTPSNANNRIEGNNVVNNGRGIYAELGGNLIIKNSASDSTIADYVIVPGNTVGPILGVADPIVSNNPWANFSY
jgi:parallel beta-helix repeat protein